MFAFEGDWLFVTGDRTHAFGFKTRVYGAQIAYAT